MGRSRLDRLPFLSGFAVFVLGVVVVTLLVSCPLPGVGSSGDPGQGTGGTGGTPEQHDELFVQQSDPASWLFTTCDSAYWGPTGYTLWSLPLGATDPFVQREVTLVKTSGNAWAGFGVAFCHVDPGAGESESMLLVMINTQQQYSAGEVSGSHYSPYTTPTWVTHASLARGYGVPNTVTVTREAGGLFTLYLNQVSAMTFHDGRTPRPGGGGNGYLVVISPQDSFPTSPVCVTFTEK